jgi:hypothetical protein
MSKRDLIVQEIGRLPEHDLDRLLTFLRALAEEHVDGSVSTIAAEPALAKDWLTPEEDEAWADL